MGINDNYVKALTKMASDPKNQEAYRQRVATIQADMQRVREQEVLADFNQWKTDNGVVDVPQPKAPVMKSVDELRKPTQTREYNKKLANDQRIKETLARKQINVAPYRKNYGNINVSKRERQQNKDGSYSTILGASNAFAGNNGEYEVSYSPFLQTGTGTPEKLDDSTMQTYINSVLREAEKKPGGATEKNILAVDKQGYNVNGKQISGMIAGAAKYGANGENDPNVQRVIRSAEEMHYAGEYYDKLADSAKAKDIVMKQNKGRDEYVRRQQVKEATMKQNQGRDKYILNQQKLEAATPVTTPEQTKSSPVSNYLTGNSAPNNSFYNNTGVSVSRTADKKAKAVQQESVLVKDMNNAAEVDGVVNQWLAKDKLTGAEKKQAQKIYQQKKHALDLASSDWYRTMSTADATKKYNEELQKIEPLNLKSRGSMPFNYGLFKGLGTNSILKAEGDLLSKVTGDEGYKDAFNGVDTLSNMAQEENNVAYGAGNLTGELLKNAAEYGVANEVIGASRLGQAINNGTKKLPGGRFFGDAYANLATGQLADTLIDTPRTIAYNARDGKYIDENGNVDMAKVMADIGINQAVNLGFNTAFGVGDVVRGLKARNVAKKESKEAFRDLLDTTTRNTPEAVAREEADLLAQARQYGEARKIAEANNAKVQLQTPEATAKEEAELLAQARAMGEERAKASKQFEKVKESVLKDFDPNSNRSWQKTINKLSEYRKKYGDSANEDIMSFARDLESYSKGIEGTEVEKVLGPRRTVNVTERPRRFNGDMRTSEDFARNSTYIAEPLQREGMREAIGEDLYNRLEKSYVNWMDEYFRMDKTAGAANELELRAKYLEDTLDDVAKVTGDDFSNIKNAIRQNNELAIADNYGTTKFVTDYKGDHAGTKAKEPGYQFSDLTEEESELVDRSLRSARSAVGELYNRVREIQNRYNDWTKSGYGGNTYNPVSDTLAAQLDELKSSYNIYADAIADPAHEGLGYAKRALIRDLEKTRKLVNEEGKFNVNFGKQLTMDINGAEKAIYGHKIGDVINNNPSHFSKNLVDSEGKLAHNEGIKEKTDYGNGGIIKETGTEETVRRSGLQNNETLGNDSGAYGRDSVGPEGAEIYPGLPRGRRQGSGDSTVSTGVVVRDNVRKAMDEQGVSNMGLKDSSGNYSRYSEALSSARKANEYGAFVDSKTVDELTERGAKAYLNDEGTAGVAVMNDGNIVGVFKHPSDTRKGASTDLIITARENGGDRLDCYGAKLVRKYSEGGFEPVARVKYEYGINPEMDSYMKLKKSENPNFKEPEIYFMKVRDGESVEDSLKALSNGSSPVYTPKQLSELPLMDYEAAEAYRDSLIEQAKQSSANNTAFSMRKNNADRLATDVKSFANRTELKKPSTAAETKEPVPTLTAKPQKEEKPFKDALDSRLTKDGEVERSFAMNTRVGKVEGIPKEVQQQFMDEPAMYKQLKNADTVANAMKAREEAGDIGRAYTKFRGMLREKNPEAIVMGHQLAKEYSAMGDYDMASTVIRETAEELTKAGQFTQAAAIAMMKDDPMTARAYLEKEIDALNRNAKNTFGDGFENFKLTNDEKEMFNSIKPGDTKALQEAYDKVGARLGREYPVTLWKKVTEGRHLAMLFNPRTHIRNTVANVLLLPQRTVSNRVNAVLEKGMSAINKDFDVSQSLKGGSKSQKAVGDYLYKNEVVNALENAQKYVEDIGGKGGSKLSDYAKDADVFKGTALSHWLNKKTNGKLAEAVKKMGGNGAESMLELLRRMDYKALDVEDQIFVKRNFVDRLASYMAAKGIKPSDEVLAAMKSGNNKELVDNFLAEIPPEGISLALDEALKATFKDDNAFTKLLVGGKKLAPHVGEFIMPFTKTPANLAVRAYDYSPAGAIHGIIKTVKSKDVQGIRNGLDRLSKGLTGTGMLAAGYALRQSGLITGNYDSDKDKKQQQIKEGYKPYAIHLGDKYYTYDWAEPASSALVMASEIYDAMNDGKEETNAVVAGAKAIQTGVDTWVNSSPLSSFADLMGSGSVSSSVGERAMENVLNFPGSFVPAAVSATAKVSDTTQRNTYDPNNPLKSAVNQTIAKIPELSKKLPAKYDTWGNEIKRYNSKGEAAFANYLNPGVYSAERHTPVDDAIEKLYEETGDNGVYPLTAEYKIDMGDGTQKQLSSKEQSEYQKKMGKASYTMVSNLLKSENLKSLDASEQADVIRGLYTFSKNVAQKDIAEREIKDSTVLKAYEEYEKAGGGDKGLQAVTKYYENKAILNKNGLSNTAENQELLNKSGVKAVQQEADIKAALKEAGLQNNEKNRELYKSGGEEALQQKANRTEVLKEYGYSSGTKAATVYDEKGEEGLKVLTETKSKLESGNQTTSVKNAMNYLDKQSMSDEDKGYYLSQSMSNMGGKAKAYVDKGDYEGFYEYEQKRTAADGDKNGTLKKSEVTDYLDSQNMTASQKKFWFEQLGQKKWKNPYK